MSEAALTTAVHEMLLASAVPLHRGDIVRRLRTALPYLQRCAISTTERRVKEAINDLIRRGVPVVSDGQDGFRIAKGKQEVEEAAKKLKKAGISMLTRASRLEGIPLERTMRQAALEFGGGQ
jgi:biotin operon repressor